MADENVKSLRIRTCQHFLNGAYSVSLFDNGDLMCKFCASELITSGKPGNHIVEAEAVEMYRHLQKIYDEKAGDHDPDYPRNYLFILKGLGVLPPDLLRYANSLES